MSLFDRLGFLGLAYRALLPSLEGEFVNVGWSEDVPLHASFDQARVADDRC